jgi:two-component system response regulator NreC
MRILLCEDHALIRLAITSQFNNEPGYRLVGETENGNDLIKQYELLKPDLVITDLSMPGLSGTAAVKQLKSKHPVIKVLFISFLREKIIFLVLKAGGFGFISKNILKGKLLEAIDKVYQGRHYFGPGYDELKLFDLSCQFGFSVVPLRSY